MPDRYRAAAGAAPGGPAFADHADDHLDQYPFEQAKGVLDEKDSAV
jgi:hypothetical protein